MINPENEANARLTYPLPFLHSGPLEFDLADLRNING